MDLRRFFVSNSALLAQQAIGALLAFILPVYLARVTNSSVLGSYFLYLSLQSVLLIVVMLGSGAAIIKFVSSGNEPPGRYVGSALSIVGVLLVIAIIFIFVFRNSINQLLGSDAWYVLVIGLPIMTLANLYSTVLIGENRVPANALTSFIGQSATVPIQIAVATLGLVPLMTAYNIQFVIVIVLAILLKETRTRIPTRKSLRTVVGYGSRAAISNIEERVFQWADLLLIGVFLAQSDAGVYGVVWSVSAIAFIPARTLGTTLLPEVSKMEGADRSGDLTNALSISLFAVVSITVPFFIGSMLVGEEILSVVYGQEYASAWLVLVVALLGRVFHGFHRIGRNALLALNLPDVTFKVGVLSFVVNVSLNVLLISVYGILGAAIATTISIFLSTIPFLYFASREANGRIVPLRDIGHVVIAGIGLIAVVYPLSVAWPPTTLIPLLSIIAIGAIVYWIIMALINQTVQQVILEVVEISGIV